MDGEPEFSYLESHRWLQQGDQNDCPPQSLKTVVLNQHLTFLQMHSWLHFLSFPPPRNSCLIPCLVLPKTSFKVCCPRGQVQLCSISSFGKYHLRVYIHKHWLKGASSHHRKPKLIQVACAVRNMTDSFQMLIGIRLWKKPSPQGQYSTWLTWANITS